MNRIEGERPSIASKNHAESHEDLLVQVSKTIHANLLTSDLLEKIVEKSAHGRKFSSDEYSSVTIAFETGEEKFNGGVSVQPRLSSPSDRITPKLYRIFKKGMNEDREKCLEAATSMWNGVSDEQRHQLFGQAIEYAVTKWTEDVNGLKELLVRDTDPEDQEANGRFLQNAEDKLAGVLKLKEDFEQDKIKLGVGWAHASLGAV